MRLRSCVLLLMVLIALKKTPEMLPVLKEVGVVDSGGQGLVYIYEGFLSALTGEYIVSEDFEATPLLCLK